MRHNARLIFALLLAQSISVATAAEGPIQLDEYGMDAVTAGSTNPVVPGYTSSAALALQNLPPFYSPFTSPSTSNTTSLTADFASAAQAWVQSQQNGGAPTSGTGTTSGTGSTSASGSGDSQDEENASSGGGNAASDALANLGLGGGAGNNTNPGGGTTTPVVTTIPNAGTIDFTGSGAGTTSLTIYTPQAPAGHLRDFFHHSVQNQW